MGGCEYSSSDDSNGKREWLRWRGQAILFSSEEFEESKDIKISVTYNSTYHLKSRLYWQLTWGNGRSKGANREWLLKWRNSGIWMKMHDILGQKPVA